MAGGGGTISGRPLAVSPASSATGWRTPCTRRIATGEVCACGAGIVGNGSGSPLRQVSGGSRLSIEDGVSRGGPSGTKGRHVEPLAVLGVALGLVVLQGLLTIACIEYLIVRPLKRQSEALRNLVERS